ncbi:hypothetical protein [Anaerolentibacter hominis]|uniref:hypothetical protein n=1 Tax=Anaerolentibacter hominis TaxID=3079009 RepID=UPI0031B8AE97
MLISFYEPLRTAAGDTLLIAGFRAVGERKDNLELPPNPYFPPEKDPVKIDLNLARFLELALPEDVIGAAAVLRMRDIACSCGGIIGDPHISPVAAGGPVDELREGFTLLSAPGGPGCIAQLPAVRMNEIYIHMRNLITKKEKIRYLAAALSEAPRYLIADDGSGPGATGFLQLKDEDTLSTYSPVS